MTSVLERASEKPAFVTDDVPNVYLFPGHIFTSAEPAIVSTILGSCVAVCFWDAEAGVAGINHYLLPSNPSRSTSDMRYGNNAMVRLLDAMLQRGASVKRLVAKIVGGASVLEAFSAAHRSIGDQNVVIARDFLKAYEIHVIGDQTGGRRGRKLLFHTGSGSAYVKEI